jgi:hypothetical protein
MADVSELSAYETPWCLASAEELPARISRATC